MPERIQRKRTKGWRMPPNTIYVGRGSKWGNPFKVEFSKDCGYWVVLNKTHYPYSLGGYSKRDAQLKAIELFKKYIRLPSIKEHLKGKNLACWCKLGEPCHADILLELANN